MVNDVLSDKIIVGLSLAISMFTNYSTYNKMFLFMDKKDHFRYSVIITISSRNRDLRTSH